MAQQCKDCDRLQTKQIGSAPERPAFQQPTMYDHFANFQKFKQIKQFKKEEDQRQLELSKCNANFTNYMPNVEPTKDTDDCRELSPQDIEKFRQLLLQGDNDEHKLTEESFSHGACAANTADSCKDSEGNASDNLALQKKKSLLTITRTPVQCPISDCQRSIGLTSVLSHYLCDHHEDFGVQCQEIFLGKSSTLIFDPNTLDYGENVCLGVLAYGGRADDRSSRPAERGICIHSAFLPKHHENLEAHLPILIMACRTAWTALLGNKELENKKANSNANGMQELLVIWLASLQTTKPIHCTLTVYDKLMTSSRSSIIRLRHLNDSQKPSEFVLKDTNCLRLSHGEINILSQDRKECIQMEIMINEYE